MNGSEFGGAECDEHHEPRCGEHVGEELVFHGLTRQEYKELDKED